MGTSPCWYWRLATQKDEKPNAWSICLFGGKPQYIQILLKNWSKPGHGQFFFSVWNSHYIPSVRPTTESSFRWQLWLPGSTFVIVDPEQGIVFPLIKRKTLNYLMQLEPWSYKYTCTEKSEKECFSNMFFSIIILCYIVNIW